MQRTYLDVPFEEKDEARQLGARWDKSTKRWYIFADQDAKPFSRWHNEATTTEPSLTGPPNAFDHWVNVRSDAFYLASTHHTCMRCQLRTPIYGFILPRTYLSMALQLPAHLSDGHGQNSVYSYPDFLEWINSDVSRAWVSQSTEAMPYGIYYLSGSLIGLMRETAPNFRKVKKTWVNTCIHCRSALADVVKERSPLLLPRSSTAAAYIELTPVDQPFQAGARGLITGIDFVDRMAIKSH